MNRTELFPSRSRLMIALALGSGMAMAGFKLWQVFAGQQGGPSLAWIWPALLLAGGGITALRAAASLLRPRPCFSCDAGGFSVMGRKPRRWTELSGVSVRTLSVAFLPAARWVSFELRKTEGRRGGKLDIPWTHMPASAAATAAHIETLAAQYRAQRATAPTAYDPYDPAALSHARARAH